MNIPTDKEALRKQQALQLLQGGQPAAARELLAGVCEKQQHDAEAWLLLGACHEAESNDGQALDCFQKAVALQPALFQAHLSLGNLYSKRQAYAEAQACYARAHTLQPRNPGVIGNMGNTWLLVGDFRQAADSFRRVLELSPDVAPAREGLGLALLGLQEVDAAIACFNELLSAHPEHFATWMRLGEIHATRGDYSAALHHVRRAVELNPHAAVAVSALAELLVANGDSEASIPVFEQLLALVPGDPAVLNRYGSALQQHGNLPAARQQFLAALERQPDFSDAWNNLGLACFASGELAEAESCFHSAIAHQPDYPDAYNNLASTLNSQKRHEEALEACQAALQKRPGFLEAWANYGVALRGLHRYCEAADAFREALKIDPHRHALYNTMADVLYQSGQVEEALDYYRRSKALCPDDPVLDELLVFCMNYLDLPADEVYRAHTDWAAAPVLQARAAVGDFAYTGHERPRVGIVSPDFYQHSVAYFLEPALAGLAGKPVDVYAYSDVKNPDTMTLHLQSLVGHWRDCLGLDDDHVLEQIRSDEIDILVDLAGHTHYNRLPLFARRAAPVQVSWLGYPNTTGLDTMDYRITDAIADPPGITERYHSEQLLRMPGAFLCYRGIERDCNVSPLPALAKGYITFGSFNNLAKITPDVVSLWAEILLALPASRLLVKNKPFTDAGIRERYYRLFAERGIGRERLDFRGYLTLREHLALYGEVDIALDTFPYNGTTTTCEALWMGVPVIALAGQVHAGRVSASLLTHTGLEDWVAPTRAGYLELACRRATDLNGLAQLRAGLRERMRRSSLCDVDSFSTALAQLFTDLWKKSSG